MKYSKLFLISAILTTCLYVTLVLTTVFRVTDVNVKYSVYDDEDYTVATGILSSYKGKNLAFIDTDEIALKITENTSLKVRTIKKQYPFTLTADLYSSEERFAVKLKGIEGFYVLDVDYVAIKTRSTAVNPSDNLSDLLLIFDTKLQPEITLKEELRYDNELLLNSLKTAIRLFESPRDRLYSVTVTEMPEKDNYRLEFLTRSGVTIRIFKATEKTYEKVSAGIAKYQTLTDNDLLSGVIECLEKSDGQVVATYTKVVVGAK